ncbi:MAG TPA: hypothetical protein VF646_17510, partial [Cytophagales bacterium]
MMRSFLLRRGLALLLTLLLGLLAVSSRAAGLDPEALFFASATPSPTSLTLSATEKFASVTQKITVTVKDVSANHVTTVKVPDFCEIASETTGFAEFKTVTGNGAFAFFVRLKSTLAPGGFKSDILITGSEVGTSLIAVQGFVFPNPSFFPKSLFFSTQVGKPSLSQELSVSTENLSASAQTKITSASSLFQVAAPDSATFGNSVTLTGNGTRKVRVKFMGSATAGTVTGNLQV